MITLDVEQGSDAWIAARLGIPTASNFDRIITKTGKPSAQADRYVAKLTAEWFLGYSLDEASSGFMDRGTELEPQAVADYEFRRDIDTCKVGLCLRDDGKVGASPDRLVGGDGLLEVKCPSAEVQMMYLIDGPPADYYVQVQGQLWITGRLWCDLYCWHPYFPAAVKRYERDPEFIDALGAEVEKFLGRLDAAKAKMSEAKAEYMAKMAELPAQFQT